MKKEPEMSLTMDSNQNPMAKPLWAIEKLIECFRTKSIPVITQDQDAVVKLHNDQGELQVLCVLEGEVDVYRNSDQLLFATASAPTIFGMQGSPYRYDIYKFVCKPACVIEMLPLSSALEIIVENSLVKELLICQSYFNDYHAYRTNMLISKTAYEIIRALLLELEQIVVEERVNISALNYIVERSHLGRSSIMRIMAELREGEYIKIENGKLISILRNLPKAF